MFNLIKSMSYKVKCVPTILVISAQNAMNSRPKIENYVHILCEDLGRGELWESDLRKKKRTDYFLAIYIELEVWNMFHGLTVRMA